MIKLFKGIIKVQEDLRPYFNSDGVTRVVTAMLVAAALMIVSVMVELALMCITACVHVVVYSWLQQPDYKNSSCVSSNIQTSMIVTL